MCLTAPRLTGKKNVFTHYQEVKRFGLSHIFYQFILPHAWCKVAVMKTIPLLFSTETNVSLVQELLRSGVVREGQAELGYFSDGEISFKLLFDVTAKDTVVVGSTFPPGDNLLKLCIVVNTLKIRGAKSVTAVIPYMGYSKSDTEDKPDLPINSKLFSKFIESAGATKVITIDLHSTLNESYFQIPLVHLTTTSLIASHFNKFDPKDTAIAAPDFGAEKMARKLAKVLDPSEMIVIEKRRPDDTLVQVVKVSGSPEGKTVIIADDMIQSGNTLVAAAKAFIDLGAREIYAFATHMVWNAGGAAKISESGLFKEVVITDTIPKPDGIELPGIFKILSVSGLIASSLSEPGLDE